MSETAWSIFKATQRLKQRDPSLKRIYLFNKQHTDTEVAELVECLLAHHEFITHVELGRNRLTDETGVKLARYVAASSNIQLLDLSSNHLGSATYLKLAAALRINTSLQRLDLDRNQAVDESLIDAAFVETLRLNSSRPTNSRWWLYSTLRHDFSRLRDEAEQQGHPTLQMILNDQLELTSIRSIKR